MEILRTGVIGAGLMGERHCRVYSNLRGVEFAGVFDLNVERGQTIAERYQTRYFATPEDLLREVDAVTIATPTPYHHDLALQAFETGVHTLIEKPLALDVEQAEAIARSARNSNLIVQVGHIERFNPAYIELKNVSSDLPVVAVTIRRLNSFDASNTDVDVIFDLMIHDIDLLLNLVGQPVEALTAYGRSARSGAIDHAVANFCFKDGPIATITASRVTQQKVRAIEITARDAYVEGDLMNKSLAIHRRIVDEYVYNHPAVKYRQESVIERIHVPVAEPLMLQLQHFVDCIRANRTPDVSAQDGLNAMYYAAKISEMVRSASPSPNLPLNGVHLNGEH